MVEDKYWGKWQYFVALWTGAGNETLRGLTVPGDLEKAHIRAFSLLKMFSSTFTIIMNLFKVIG